MGVYVNTCQPPGELHQRELTDLAPQPTIEAVRSPSTAPG